MHLRYTFSSEYYISHITQISMHNKHFHCVLNILGHSLCSSLTDMLIIEKCVLEVSKK